MIKYLNNAANEIQYVNQDGETIVVNPFDPRFMEVSQRLSLIHSVAEENRKARAAYEDTIQKLQAQIDAGVSSTDAAPVAPTCKICPEDYTLPVSYGSWEPPLLGLVLPAEPRLIPDVDADGVHPAVVAALSDPHRSAALATVLEIVHEIAPAIPALIAMFQSLTRATTK